MNQEARNQVGKSPVSGYSVQNYILVEFKDRTEFVLSFNMTGKMTHVIRQTDRKRNIH